jgi:hypothetical protein
LLDFFVLDEAAAIESVERKRTKEVKEGRITLKRGRGRDAKAESERQYTQCRGKRV